MIEISLLTKEGRVHALGVATDFIIPVVAMYEENGVTQRPFKNGQSAIEAYEEILGKASELGWKLQFRGLPNWG